MNRLNLTPDILEEIPFYGNRDLPLRRWSLAHRRDRREPHSRCSDELKEGDQILVKVLALEGNKIKLSRKAVLREQREKLTQPKH